MTSNDTNEKIAICNLCNEADPNYVEDIDDPIRKCSVCKISACDDCKVGLDIFECGSCNEIRCKNHASDNVKQREYAECGNCEKSICPSCQHKCTFCKKQFCDEPDCYCDPYDSCMSCTDTLHDSQNPESLSQALYYMSTKLEMVTSELNILKSKFKQEQEANIKQDAKRIKVDE